MDGATRVGASHCMELDDYVSLISAPTADKPFGHTYTVSRLGNVVEDGGVRYLNLEPAELKRVAIAQLKDDLPVWFGCDVAQSYLRDEGIMTVSIPIWTSTSAPSSDTRDMAWLVLVVAATVPDTGA